MTPEEQFNQEVWFVLNKIKKCSFSTGKDGIIKYRIKSPPDLKVEGMPFPVEESEIVNKLQDSGAIKIIPPDDVAEVSNSEEALSKGQNVFIVIRYLKIIELKFEEVYSNHKNKYEQRENLIKDDEKLIEKWFNYKNNSITFYGDIYKPRGEFQAKFIKQLTMKHQRENNNGTILREGKRVSEMILSKEINVSVERLRDMKKQLNRSFKDKGFPLKIDSNAGEILLIYTI